MAPQVPRLPASGYMIVSLDLNSKVLQAALVQAKEQPFTQVFLEVDGEDDPTRLQSRVKCKSAALTEIRSAVQVFAGIACDKWTADVFSFMVSRPGGSIQAAHQDYTPQDIARAKSAIPGSAIVSLEAGTTLRVFPDCFVEMDERVEKTVDIPPGYCIIVRGDLIHSSIGYEQTNHRIHCYLTVGEKSWVPDIVHSARAGGYFCHHCDNFEDEDAEEVHQHRFTCEKNQAAEANKAKRHTREKGIYNCDLCSEKIFTTVSGLHYHKRTKHINV